MEMGFSKRFLQIAEDEGEKVADTLFELVKEESKNPLELSRNIDYLTKTLSYTKVRLAAWLKEELDKKAHCLCEKECAKCTRLSQ